MGASSSVDEAQFNSLKNTVNSQAGRINALDALKSKVDNLSTAAASGIEYAKLAESINKETAYRENLAKAIANNPNDLGKNLAEEIGKSNSIIENINSKLSASTTLQDKVADTLSSNEKYKERIRGLKGADGNIGDQAALKSNLFDKGNTMWCADGEFCQIPTAKKGGELGGIRFSDRWSGFPDKQVNGKWNSEISNDTVDFKQLMIVGNKSGGGNRKVGIWDQLNVWGYTHLDGDLWVKGKINQRDIFAELDDLKNNAVRKDAEYAIRATQPSNDGDWVYLTRHDEWNGGRGKHATYHAGKGAWQRFKFDQY
jgi:hypothetical protein